MSAASMAALEQRLGNVLVRRFANATAVLNGGGALKGVLTRAPLDFGAGASGSLQSREISFALLTADLPAGEILVRGVPLTVYMGDQLLVAEGVFRVAKTTPLLETGETVLELEVAT